MSRAVLVGMVMCVLALAGCSAIANLTDLQAELEAAGYQINGIRHQVGIKDASLGIDAAMPDDVPTEEDANRIAEIAWTTYPVEIDRMLILINGRQMMHATAEELTEQFGERPDGLVAKSEDKTNVTAIVVVVVMALVFAGLMVLLWRRGRRPPPPAVPPVYPGGMPSVYQYPPQPPQNP